MSNQSGVAADLVATRREGSRAGASGPVRTGTSVAAVPAELPVGELIALLAQVEAAIAATPTFTRLADGGPAPMNPDLLALLAREQDLIAQLRRRPTRSHASPDLCAGRQP